MSTGHAPFPPSASERWMACTASFALGLQMPEAPSSEYADEGTRLHDVAAGALRGIPPERGDAGDADLRFLKPYLDYAAKRMKAASVSKVENWINHSQLLSGTPDLLMAFAKLDMLEVVDLKNGAGIMVYPEENKQMLTYAYMALRKLQHAGTLLPKNVRLTIVQPPDEDTPVKSWDTTSEHVLEHGMAAEVAIQAAIEGRGEFLPGKHCRFCKAKPVCPALRGELVEALASVPATMTRASLGQWLDRAERMEGFIKDVRELGHRAAEEAQANGAPPIPGWGLKPKRAMRQWADEDKVMEIARRRKIKIWQDKLLSPAMAEKAHKNLPEELREQIVAVSSGMNLVRLSADEARALEVKVPDEATKMERMMANMSLVKLRR